MRWSVEPPKSRADLLEAVERGDLRAGSWQMVVGKDEWRGDVRHVHEIQELRDVSVVVHAAYPSSKVEYRAAPVTENKPPRKEKEVVKDHQKKVEEPQEAAEERSRPSAGSLRMEERSESPRFLSLADAYAERGFFEERVASVSWDEFRGLTWSGGTVSDINPVRREGVALGYDQRWLYPVLPQTAVDAATTSVQYVRQSGRTLAGTAVIRAIDAVSTKPETAGTAELQTLTLSQVASVQSNVPRIYAAQPQFESMIEQDLRLSINDGLDELVRRGVATAGTAAAVTGDILQKVRRAMTVVQAQGYNPRVLAIDPSGAENLDLLRSSGSEQFYLYGPGQGAPSGPFGTELRVWKQAGTALLDPDAFGRLYASPVELRSFEADGGLSNRQNIRMELNAGYAVERLSAALRIV